MKVWLLIIFLVGTVKSHTECFHPIVNLTSTSVHQPETYHSRVKRSPQNIRISRYYDSSYTSMDKSDVVTKLILDPAIDFFQKSLMVKNPLSSPLLVDRECTGTFTYKYVNGNRIKVCSTSCYTEQMCYNTVIPDKYFQSCYVSGPAGSHTTTRAAGSGVPNTDLLLIISQSSSGCRGSVLAYAVACELEYTLDRPVIGLINICPGKINLGVGLSMSLATIKHEIMHVLGMSANLFSFWRDANGVALTPRDSLGYPNLGLKSIGTSRVYQYSNNTVADFVKTFNYITGPAQVTVSYIVTPTIKAEMQSHFNCPTLEGMMLEGYGSASSALSHFEKLYLQNELMTPSIAIDSLASRLTLALLQDTGWYIANLNYAENFVYGKNLGCNFITKSCFEYMNIMKSSSKSIAPYCDQSITVGGLSCSSDLKSQQFCHLFDSSTLAAEIPSMYRYFPSNKNLVSSDGFDDYCPVMLVYAKGESGNYQYTGHCQDTQNTAVQSTVNDYFNQGFGPNSICVSFDRSSKWYYDQCTTSYTPSIQGAGCYQYQCSSIYGLIIIVNNIQYQCSTENQIIDVTSKNTYLAPHGKLVCPKCSTVCNSAICASASANLPVQCNNVNRLCPGVSRYTAPCPGSGYIVLSYQISLLLITLIQTIFLY